MCIGAISDRLFHGRLQSRAAEVAERAYNRSARSSLRMFPRCHPKNRKHCAPQNLVDRTRCRGHVSPASQARRQGETAHKGGYSTPTGPQSTRDGDQADALHLGAGRPSRHSRCMRPTGTPRPRDVHRSRQVSWLTDQRLCLAFPARTPVTIGGRDSPLTVAGAAPASATGASPDSLLASGPGSRGTSTRSGCPRSSRLSSEI